LRRVLLAGPALPSVPQAEQRPAGSGIHSASLPEKTQDYLRRQFSALLQLPAYQIDSQAPLEIYGIDSILAMKLTNQLEQTFGSLPKTLFFECQTIAGLTGYFMQKYSEKLAAIFAGSANRSRVPNTLNAPPSKSAQTDLVP